MPPPQCPECGRFLATAFAQQIKVTPAPCPKCGTILSLGDSGTMTASGGEVEAPVDPATEDITITLDEPAEPVAPAEPKLASLPPRARRGATIEEVAAEVEADAEPAAVHEPATAVVAEPAASVRPVDLTEDASPDPLAGWDVGADEVVAAPTEPDMAAMATAAGAGLVLGMLLGGRRRRMLRGLLGAVLGAVIARLRG